MDGVFSTSGCVLSICDVVLYHDCESPYILSRCPIMGMASAIQHSLLRHVPTLFCQICCAHFHMLVLFVVVPSVCPWPFLAHFYVFCVAVVSFMSHLSLCLGSLYHSLLVFLDVVDGFLWASVLCLSPTADCRPLSCSIHSYIVIFTNEPIHF